MPVRTGVIAAAGFGTRFLPITKTIPKEMLPVIDRPMIHYTVEEATEAGIFRLVLISSRSKGSMQDYFKVTNEQDQVIQNLGASSQLESVSHIARQIEMITVHQEKQLGLGHAILMAKQAVGNEPFVVYLPDDIIRNSSSVTSQLLNVHQIHGGSVIAVEEISNENVSAYGVIDAERISDRVYRVNSLVEKPSPKDAPSNLGIVGRYVLSPSIFSALEQIQPGAKGEIQLTDGISLMSQHEPVYAYKFIGKRYDVGHPFGLLQASIELALEREDIGNFVKTWLHELTNEL
jgi:UTP--glucose-1-phosphate uridylyltransferase